MRVPGSDYKSPLYAVGGVSGLTFLDSIIYVVCEESSVIRLYNTDTCSPLDVVINVDGMRDPRDIVVCRHDRQLYVADWPDSIWLVSVDGHSYVKWLTSGSTTDIFPVAKLSVTSRRLLVTSPRSLHQYNTTSGQVLRVDMPRHVQFVYHSVEARRNTFVISHRGTSLDERQDAVSHTCAKLLYCRI